MKSGEILLLKDHVKYGAFSFALFEISKETSVKIIWIVAFNFSFIFINFSMSHHQLTLIRFPKLLLYKIFFLINSTFVLISQYTPFNQSLFCHQQLFTSNHNIICILYKPLNCQIMLIWTLACLKVAHYTQILLIQNHTMKLNTGFFGINTLLLFYYIISWMFILLM